MGKSTLIYTFEHSNRSNLDNDVSKSFDNNELKIENDAIDIGKVYQLSDGSLVKCFLYDTNGEEKYGALSDNYYRKADGCLLVYDITNRDSFDSIKNNYIPKIKDVCKKNIQIVLIGNKIDLDFDRQVTVDEGSKLAINNNFNNFKETSCVDNINVINVFQSIIELSKFELKKNDNNTSINDNIKEPVTLTKTTNSNKVKKKNGC